MLQHRQMKLLLFLLLTTYAQAELVSFYDNAGPRGCVKCNGRWAVHNRTASGVRPKAGVTCAANQYPFGTKLYIQGIGTRIVQDRTTDRHSNRIDVFVRTHAEAKKLGIKKMKV